MGHEEHSLTNNDANVSHAVSDKSLTSPIVNTSKAASLNLSSSSQSLTQKEKELGICIEEDPFNPQENLDWRLTDSYGCERMGEDAVILRGNRKKVRVPTKLLDIKESGGKTWIAALPEAQGCSNVLEILNSFSKPGKGDKFVEKEARNKTWRTMVSFLNSNGSFQKALGGWSKDPDSRTIIVEELPAKFRDIIEGNSSPKTSPAQSAFKFAGKKGNFTNGFFEAVCNSQTYEEFRG